MHRSVFYFLRYRPNAGGYTSRKKKEKKEKENIKLKKLA